MTTVELDSFTLAYVEAALWSTMDYSDEQGGESFDVNYSIADIHPNTIAKMAKDCADFQAKNQADIELAEMDDDDAGHCFWLDRVGAAGFWDFYLPRDSPAYEAAQALAMVTRDFSVRDNLKTTENDPYHACQRLSNACKPYGEFNLYLGDDGMIHGS